MNWHMVQLQDLALPKKGSIVSGPFGSNIGSRFFVEEGIPVIRGNNLTVGRERFVDEGFVFLTEEKASEFKNCEAIKDDIIFTAAGTIGQVGLIPENTKFEKYIISNKQLRVRIDTSKANPVFVYYWLTTREMNRHIIGLNNGGAVPLINLSIIRKLPVPLPPYEKQEKIVSIISAYDSLIENNRRRIQLLEQSARLLYREWFVHLRFPGHEHVRIIDGVPEGWELKRVEDVAETIGGGTPSTKVTEYWDDGEITWFIPSDLTRNDCLVLLKSKRKITESGLKESSAKMLPPETILMTSRATLGFFGLHDGKACTNQGFISIIPRIENFRMYMLQNLIYRKEQIISLAGGTTYKEINKTTFRNMNIVIPSLELLKEYEEFAYNLIKHVRIIKKQNQKLIEARDILLPRLMNGAITV